jgi:cytolethal distending toxin subunit B
MIVAVLAFTSVAVSVFAATTKQAMAAAPNSPYVATWNLQGASHSTEVKWDSGVAPMMSQNRLVALQEAGSVPDRARFWEDHSLTDSAGRQWTVREYNWLGSDSRLGYWIYWLETDPNGRRVNLALVSATHAADIDVVAGPNRPGLGIRIGVDWYFSVHGSAGNHGGDVPTLLGNINNAVANKGYDDWFALGDFNREPETLENIPNLGVVCPPASPTHPATAPVSKFDYMVRDFEPKLTGDVLQLQMSDHLPARFSFPPTTFSIDDDTGTAESGGDTGTGQSGGDNTGTAESGGVGPR